MIYYSETTGLYFYRYHIYLKVQDNFSKLSPVLYNRVKYMNFTNLWIFFSFLFGR